MGGVQERGEGGEEDSRVGEGGLGVGAIDEEGGDGEGDEGVHCLGSR